MHAIICSHPARTLSLTSPLPSSTRPLRSHPHPTRVSRRSHVCLRSSLQPVCSLLTPPILTAPSPLRSCLCRSYLTCRVHRFSFPSPSLFRHHSCPTVASPAGVYFGELATTTTRDGPHSFPSRPRTPQPKQLTHKAQRSSKLRWVERLFAFRSASLKSVRLSPIPLRRSSWMSYSHPCSVVCDLI